MRRAVLVAAGVFWAAVSPAAAQESAPHRGFWIGFGLGGGWNTAKNVDNDTKPGGAMYLRLGGTPNRQLLLGGELSGWYSKEGDADLTRGNVTFSALFYPGRRGGFFLKGGVGASSVSTAVSSGAITVTETHEGFGTTVGLGYDVRLGRNFFLTPNADFLFQKIEGAQNTLVLLSVGATWH
jgi:hypothetical protein